MLKINLNVYIEDTVKTTAPSEDASITSEQLLIALTSIPTTEGSNTDKSEPATNPPPAAPPPEDSEMEEATVTEPTASKTPVKTVSPLTEKADEVETQEVAAAEAETASTNDTTATKAAETPVTAGLGILPKDDTPISSKPDLPSSATHAGSPLKNVSSPLKFTNNNSDTASNLSATLSAAPNISISNLPDIKAALRRLSSANVSASVIEQLSTSSSSSSPRLNERKGSIADVSPSEILGNALAAVAATAARSNPSTSTAQTPSTTNTAAAIGNLAAITANISNLLHSGAFHRNSFSQEDTQKLVAAVSRNTPQQEERRKSSVALVGNAFSNMIDQAIMIGRKSISENQQQQKTMYSPTPPPPSKPKLIVKNEQVWKSVEGIEETTLGFELYSPHLILPNLEKKVNGLMEIRVPARFLTFENMQVQKRAIWGTDIYTDDSDIVASKVYITM